MCSSRDNFNWTITEQQQHKWHHQQKQWSVDETAFVEDCEWICAKHCASPRQMRLTKKKNVQKGCVLVSFVTSPSYCVVSLDITFKIIGNGYLNSAELNKNWLVAVGSLFYDYIFPLSFLHLMLNHLEYNWLAQPCTDKIWGICVSVYVFTTMSTFWYFVELAVCLYRIWIQTDNTAFIDLRCLFRPCKSNTIIFHDYYVHMQLTAFKWFVWILGYLPRKRKKEKKDINTFVWRLKDFHLRSTIDEIHKWMKQKLCHSRNASSCLTFCETFLSKIHSWP